MAGAVGGFTSKLSLEVEGFDKATKALKSLYIELDKIKSLAGTLGKLNIKISIDNGDMAEAQKRAEDLKKKQREFKSKSGQTLISKLEGGIGSTDKNALAFDREKRKKEESDKKALDQERKDRDKKLKEAHKNTVDMLNGFGTALKWTAGIILTFGTALAVATVKNAKENTNTSNQAAGYGMSPIDLFKLQNVGKIYGNGDKEAFTQPLNALRTLKTEPIVAGDINSKMLSDLYQASGRTLDIQALTNRNNSVQDNLNQMYNTFSKAWSKASSSGNKEEQVKIAETLKSYFGEGFFNTIVGTSTSGIKTLSGATSEAAKGLATKPEDFPTNREFSKVSGKTLALLDSQLNAFLTELESDFITPLTNLNIWMTANKEAIRSFGKDLADLITGLFTLDFGKIGKSLQSIQWGGEKGSSLRKLLGWEDEKGAFKAPLNNPFDLLKNESDYSDIVKSLLSTQDKLKVLGYSVGEDVLANSFRKTGNVEKVKEDLLGRALDLGPSKSTPEEVRDQILSIGKQRKTQDLIGKPATQEQVEKFGINYQVQPNNQPQNIQLNVDLKIDHNTSRLQQKIITQGQKQATWLAAAPMTT